MSEKKKTRVCKTVGYVGILPKMRTAMRNFADAGVQSQNGEKWWRLTPTNSST